MSMMARIFLLVLAFCAAAPASAACAVSASAAIFEASSSYAVRSGTIAPVNASAGFACNGSLITLLYTNQAKARMTSANGFRLANGAGDTIAYAVSADPAGSYNFTQGGTIDYFDPTLLSLLTILNGGTFNPRIYARISGGANIAAGTYTDTLTVQWNWNVCHGVGVGGVCVVGESGTGTAIIPVTMVVGRDCRIDAPPLSFGTASLVSQFVDVTQTIRADCTKGSAYSVSLTSGGNGTARPWRAMRNAQGQTLRYNLYRSDGTTIWDETNPQPAGSAGTGNTTPTTPFTYRARIDPSQPTPPAGAYSDVVSVLISF